MGRKLLVAGASLVLAGICALTLIWRDYSGRQVEARAPPSCDGPWSECSPGSRWLRRVLARGGFADPGPGTGSALLIPGEGPQGRYFWAVRGAGRPDPVYSLHVELPRVGETVIFS